MEPKYKIGDRVVPKPEKNEKGESNYPYLSFETKMKSHVGKVKIIEKVVQASRRYDNIYYYKLKGSTSNWEEEALDPQENEIVIPEAFDGHDYGYEVGWVDEMKELVGQRCVALEGSREAYSYWKEDENGDDIEEVEFEICEIMLESEYLDYSRTYNSWVWPVEKLHFLPKKSDIQDSIEEDEDYIKKINPESIVAVLNKLKKVKEKEEVIEEVVESEKPLKFSVTDLVMTKKFDKVSHPGANLFWNAPPGKRDKLLGRVCEIVLVDKGDRTYMVRLSADPNSEAIWWPEEYLTKLS